MHKSRKALNRFGVAAIATPIGVQFNRSYLDFQHARDNENLRR
jgi:hypothetical protein